MSYPDIFSPEIAGQVIGRINELTPQSRAQWGKMSVSQMMAHSNVAYELVYDNKHSRPNAFMGFMLRMFIKNMVVGNKPYKRMLPRLPHLR